VEQNRRTGRCEAAPESGRAEKEGGGQELGLQGVGVLDVSFEHLDGVPVRLPHPPPPPPPPPPPALLIQVPRGPRRNPLPPRRDEAGAGALRLRWEGRKEGR